MIPVKQETEKIIIGNNRLYKASVCFNFLSCKIPESIKIQALNAVKGSVPDQIVYPFLSYIQNRFFVRSNFASRLFPNAENIHKDGRLHPVKNRPYSRIGYIGKKASQTGDVDDTVTLYLPETSLKKITLITSDDRIITNAVITAKTRFGKTIASFIIHNNLKNKIVFDLPCDKAGILELHVTKATPDRHIWVLAFYPGFEFLIHENDIVKIKHQKRKTENKEGSIGRLYVNSLDLELNNLTRLYDKQNINSPLFGFFNSNTTCSVSLLLKQSEHNKPFYLNFGSFYIMNIKNDEQKATVSIKAQDYIGVNKNKYLSLGIQDNSDAYSCFVKIANALSLSASRIDQSLKLIKLKRLPLNGTVGNLLNNLCILTNAFCSCDETGSALIASLILSKHGSVRYPVRYFLLNEFKSNNSGESSSAAPNIINLSYSNYEYEGEYQIGQKDVVLYSEIGKLNFPEQYKNTPYGEYPIGGGLSPSWTKVFNLPSNFEAIEFSDTFIPKGLEYSIDYSYSPEGKATKAAVKVWNFITRNEGEQLSILIMIKEKPIQILLKKENFEIPKRPQTYIIPDENENFDTADPTAVESRNEKNKPEEFKIELKDSVSVSSVEIANKFLKSKFEFSYRKTAEGLHVKVWNYFPDVHQTLTVNIYGNRLIPGKEKKTITARNNDDIQVNGEIIKNIEVGALASDDIARIVLNSMAYYYRHFSNNLSVQAWADPRLILFDLIAFKSLRGHGFTQGIIDEIELEYNGSLSQKIKIRQTKKHNRDSRIFSHFVLSDRPLQNKKLLQFI